MTRLDAPHRLSFNLGSSKGSIMRRFVALVLSSTLVLQVAPLVAAPATRGIRAVRVQAPATTGAITGTAKSSTGKALPNHTVQVRNLQTGQLAGTTTSNAAGEFSFASLSPGNYVIEVVNPAGAIVGSSTSIAVVAGATVTVPVAATAAATGAGAVAGAATGGGISTAVVVTTVAVAAGITGVVIVAKNRASPSK
jgi:hypothetical protein